MMWAYPNFIPLSPDVLHTMWQRLLPYEFHSVHSLSVGRDIRDPKAKSELLHDMKLQLKHQGHTKHALLDEQWAKEYTDGLDLDAVGRTDARNLKKLEASF